MTATPGGGQAGQITRSRAQAILLLLLLTPAMLTEGYDLSVMGLVAPELVKVWHIKHSALVPTLSAGVFGLFVGAPLIGYVSDRFGRKAALLIAIGGMGGFSLLSMFAANLPQLMVLRFLTGVGMGGLAPVVVALAAEAAPRGQRGLFVIVSNFGVPAGEALTGFAAAFLTPRYGWPSLFLVGGLATVVIGILCAVFLKEPPAAAPEPIVGIPSPRGEKNRLGQLFVGRFALITPMLWLVLAANQFAKFFTLSWLPTLLQKSGLNTAEASAHSSIVPLGGIVGGLVLIGVMDRLGSIPLVVLFLLGAPVVIALGFVDPSSVLLVACLAMSGLCITGNNFGVNAVSGMAYPRQVRSFGAGTAHAMGRVGAFFAQIVGGWLLVWRLPLQDLYAAPAFALLLGAAAAAILSVVAYREFGNNRLDAQEPDSDSSRGGETAAVLSVEALP